MKPETIHQFLEIIGESSIVDWHIVHKLSAITDFSYSQTDKKESYYNAFSYSMGFISLEDADQDDFAALVAEATSLLKKDLMGLAHLFIIIHRQSVRGDQELARQYKQQMIENFKLSIGPTLCRSLYDLLIQSLNRDYFTNRYEKYRNNPTVGEWLQYFAWAANFGMEDFSPYKVVQLIREVDDYSWEHDWILSQSTFLRSFVFGTRLPQLNLSPDQALGICQRGEKESRFLAALLLWESQSQKETPNDTSWADQGLVNYWILQQWSSIGKDLMLFSFGATNRVRQDRPNIKSLKVKIELALNSLPEEGLVKLVKNARFPDDFISLYQWLHENRKTFPVVFERAIVIAYLEAVIQKFNAASQDLDGVDAIDPFGLHKAFDPQYQPVLCQIGIWLLMMWDESIKKKVQTWIFQIVPLYYGRIRSIHLARNATELLLANLLSCSMANDELNIDSQVQEFSNIIIDYLIVPYVFHVGGQDAIWNYTQQKEWLHPSTHFIMNVLHRVQHGVHNHRYSLLLDAIGQSKLCPWPFEDKDYTFVQLH